MCRKLSTNRHAPSRTRANARLICTLDFQIVSVSDKLLSDVYPEDPLVLKQTIRNHLIKLLTLQAA
jgi:hypothetical protein